MGLIPLVSKTVKKFVQQYLARLDEVYGAESKATQAMPIETELLHRTLETYEHLEDRHGPFIPPPFFFGNKSSAN